jgi:rRNA-processing protein FCF1
MAIDRLRHNNLEVLGSHLATKIILDTNFLFVPSQFHLDIFEELDRLIGQQVEPLILSSTFEELQKLIKSRSVKKSKQALLGLKLAEKCRIAKIERKNDESNDDVILRAAVEMKCAVATNDRELRKKLRKAGVPVVFLRQKSTLGVDGSV